MSTERSIIQKLREYRLPESFVHSGYKYWKYGGVYHRSKIDPAGDLIGDKEEIEYDEYMRLKRERNTSLPLEYKDLDDETIHDIKRMSHVLVKVKDDEDLTSKEKERYSWILGLYIDMSQEHNIPIEDYEHKSGKFSIYKSELNHILTRYTPPLPNSGSGKPQEYEPVRREYR